MSTATSFRHHRPFPFCVPPIADDPAGADDPRIKLVDLSLADAMKLFWNTETVAISLQLMGHSAGGGGGTTIEFSGVAIPPTSGGPYAPRTRVCLSDGDYAPLPSFEALDGIFLSDAITTPIGTEDLTLDHPTFFAEIYQQEDGLYTIIPNFDFITNFSYLAASGTAAGDGGTFSYTGISDMLDLTDGNDLSSGTIPYFLLADLSDPDFVPDSINLSMSFTFYTYP